MNSLTPKDFGCTVAVIGGGFTGSLFALKLARAQPHWTVLLIERHDSPGRGLAYGACAPQHILNVPVSRMELGLEPSFADWLAQRPAQLAAALEESDGALGDAFVPRQLFGDYVRQQIQEALGQRGHAGIRRIHGEVMAISAMPRRLLLDDGRSLAADLVVLATGNPSPGIPWPGIDSRRLVADPWGPGALDAIAPQAPVLLVGTGLTMVDMLVSLEARGHHGPKYALSRHGLLPRSHQAGGSWRPVLQPGITPLQALRTVRAHLREAQGLGVPWQRVFDAARLAVASVWQAWTQAQRSQFLRHLRSRWDVFRHRMAPRIARMVERLVADGRFQALAGRLDNVTVSETGVTVDINRRGGARTTLCVAAMINCTGPQTDIRRADHALLASLFRQGLLEASALGLGLESDDCAVRGRNGKASDWLFALGPPTRSAWWEIVAVPEIKTQVDRLVKTLSRADDLPQYDLSRQFLDIGAGI